MLKNAKKINWIPAHLKEGRFGNWLEGARDWSISRQRFWASVIPIWKCDCGEMKVVGSVKELEDLSGERIVDIHKHIVDKITFKCEKCGGVMKRIPDVLDTWFDSGSMPYAQAHYPFENKESFDQTFPAQFIAEGVDQTRCWFYYLHAISTAVKGSNAFKNVAVNGIVQAEDGKKMAKRLKNYPDPSEIFDKYGADALRFYLLSSPVVSAETINFKESEVAELVRGMFRMLWNSYSFFVLYANIDKFKPATRNPQTATNLLDRWVISELNMLIRDVNESMEKYELNKAVRLFPKFIDNFSNWYIRRSRKRFWKSENDGDKNEAYQTLWYVLAELSKLMAPFTPFIAEEIYKNLTGNESVHLAEFPKANNELVDEKLNEEMDIVRKIVSEGLQLRAKAGIKVRQPLSELRIMSHELRDDLSEIIKEEVNVKNVKAVKDLQNIELDTEITEELKLEGQAREIIRHIQEMRKEAGYEVDNRIIVSFEGMKDLFKKSHLHKMIEKEVLATKLSDENMEQFDLEKDFNIDGEELKIRISK
jgi:isoleucyl-tRNA synthetase